MPRRIELYAFEYFDARTRKWIRARYRAQLDAISERYQPFRPLGAPEVRDVPDDPLYSMATSRPND